MTPSAKKPRTVNEYAEAKKSAPLTIPERVKDLRQRLEAERESLSAIEAAKDAAKREHDDVRAQHAETLKLIKESSDLIRTSRQAYENVIDQIHVKQRAIDRIAGELASLTGAQ